MMVIKCFDPELLAWSGPDRKFPFLGPDRILIDLKISG
jgi:hypothetical protein